MITGSYTKFTSVGENQSVLDLKEWCANPTTIRTGLAPIISLKEIADFLRQPSLKVYRNPVIYAKELLEEMTQDNLTRKQLA